MNNFPFQISTAIKFLENSKVQGSTVELKKSFLKKKGLSDEEIKLAFERAKLPVIHVGQIAGFGNKHDRINLLKFVNEDNNSEVF